MRDRSRSESWTPEYGSALPQRRMDETGLVERAINAGGEG